MCDCVVATVIQQIIGTYVIRHLARQYRLLLTATRLTTNRNGSLSVVQDLFNIIAIDMKGVSRSADENTIIGCMVKNKY